MEKEYIEKAKLYKEIAELEELARKSVLDTPTNSPDYSRYYAQLNERTALKHKIADYPAADVAEVVHGKWLWEKIAYLPIRPICSICFEEPYRESNNQLPNYCPNCGTKMDLK